MRFFKMHGLGNDFVVIDAREKPFGMTQALARALAHRRKGVGADQVVVLDISDDDLRLSFFNADGSTAGACGNATRCLARWLMEQTDQRSVFLLTERGRLEARRVTADLTAVNMGPPVLDWAAIPLSEPVDIDALPIEGAPMATGMGNPHCTFFVADAEAVALESFGSRYEHHPLFPQRTNVQVASVVGPDRIRVRVWERGAGITLASGSSSCAVAVAAARRGLTGRRVTIDFDGGAIEIDWRDEGVWMTGPTAHVFSGVLSTEFIAKMQS